MNNKNNKHSIDYNQITRYIYIGTNMCCQTHFKNELLDKGITADISLEKERLDSPFGVDYFLWLPTTDHTAPKFDQLNVGVKTIDTLVKLKKKIYIHCKNGHGRAPTLVAAYLISQGKTAKEAVEFIRKKRPVIHLEKKQIETLKKYNKKRPLS